MCGIDGVADVLMGATSEMPYMKRKGNIMLYGWKAKRHLALYVSIVLSCGGYSLLASPHAYADEMTVDTGAPSPGLYGTNRYYGATSLSGASSGNKLIVKGSTMATGWFMGGWAQGTSGDATNNTVEMTETAKVYSTGGGVFGVTGVYGGWSRGGNATNNTIVLSGEMSGYGDTILFGGHSETSGTDVTTGNMLWVKKEGNSAYSIFRFQKMKFSLASASPNDVMLKVNTNYGATQGFKWSDIEVENPSAWQNGAVGSKRVTLYQGPTIQLTNYDATSPVNGTSGDYEYGLTTNTTAAPGTSTVTASEIYFDRNKFQNSHVTYNDKTPQADDEKNGIYHTLPLATGVYSGAIYAGTSTLGNTTKDNVLTIDGMNVFSRTMYGGYTQSMTGDSTGNEVVLKNISPSTTGHFYIYGGWSKNGKATGNTITLEGSGGYSTGYGMYGYAHLNGGYSGKTGATTADNTAGNTLKVTAKDSGAATVENFENLKFVFGDNVASGDTMLYIRDNMQNFDWTKITVDNASTWGAGKNGTQHVTLYKGPWVSLSNYGTSPVNGTSGDYEYGMTTDTTTPTVATVAASEIYFDRNKFQNSHVTYNDKTPQADDEKNGIYHTLPLATGVYSGAIYAGTSTLGNTTKDNVLTIDGMNVFSRTMYGGYTQSMTGDSTGNEVVLKNISPSTTGHFYIYGGWSKNGKATGNTITLEGSGGYSTGYGMYGYAHLNGGYSGKTGATTADNTAGNTLKVTAKDSGAATVENFENLKFVFGDNVASGDTMLYIRDNMQNFDWTKITVDNASTWGAGKNGTQHVTLYKGPWVSLSNYGTSPVNGTSGDYEYGMTTDTTTPTVATVAASEIYFDRNKFRNSKITYTTDAPVAGEKNTFHTLPATTAPYSGALIAGVSIFGNTPTGNVLTVKGFAVDNRKLYGGYASSGTGDATGNEVVIDHTTSSSNYSNVYGGFSEKGDATGNTVTLAGGDNTNGTTWKNTYMHLYGGDGNPAAGSKDYKTGNVLQVKGKGNDAYTINNFENMKFVLGAGIGSGDIMLSVYTYNSAQTFDWKKVTVGGISDWVNSLPAGTNAPTLTLYNGLGAPLTLTNYAPSLLGNAGDYEFGTFANGTLASGTMTNATQIKLAGNKFQNVTSPVVDAATSSVHGGYSSYGNTTNTNVITVNSGAYTNVRAGYTDAVKGGSDKNELTFTGTASATNLYGGYTMGTSASAVDLKADAAAKADAKGNTVNISGGTVNANGKIAGGYIAKNPTLATPAASAGDAKGNKVNIESGTIGNNTSIYGGYTEGAGGATGNIVTISGGTFSGTGSIYGGYTEGTGKATGNIVNLGKADGTLSATGLANVTLYGGGGTSASDRVKDNVLNVNAKATAKNIQNFGKVMFNFNSTIHTGDTMLMLNDTAGTSLDWKKFDISGGGPDGETTLMHNESGIALTSYDHSRAVSSTGTKEFVIYTDTGTGTGVKKILYGGYTFKGKTSASTNAEGDIWAGRSVIGNTTSGNTLTVNNNTATYRDAYGGWTAGTGTDATGDAANSSTGNTANLVAGTVRNIYGGFTSSDGGSATGNKVNISGGTVAPASGVGGTVYGGYISSATSAGDATGNSVTITGGTVGDVYAGFTNGTGKTTGNTVNLGTKDDAVALGTVIGTIYGGNKTDTTGNTLNIYDSATAKNIQNFDTVHFKGNSPHIAAGDTLLTLTNGATNLDWKKIYVDDLDSVTASATGDHIFTLLKNTNTINLSNYSTTGTRGNIKSDDYEADLVTDGNSATPQNVYLKGYRFQNNKNAAYAGGAAPDGAWGGRSIIGKTVKNNTLTVTGGSTSLNARGGMVENTERNADGSVKTSGNAETNKLILNAGAQTADAYGAEVKTKDGSATGNEVHLTAGTVGGNVYGAALTATGATGSVTGSIVEVTGGSIAGSVYGGKTTGTGAATGHTLNLYGGSVNGSVYGGHSASGATTGNTVNLGNGTTNDVTTVTGTIYGGSGTDTTDNVLNVNTNATVGNIANFGMVNFNYKAITTSDANPMLTISGGATTFDWEKFTYKGAMPTSGKLTLMKNTANINLGTTYRGAKELPGSDTTEAFIDTNTSAPTATEILIKGYTFKGNALTPTTGSATEDVWAGRSVIGNTTTGNTLTVNGTTHRDAYGGWTAGTGTSKAAKKDSTGNTVNLMSGTVRNIYGGFTSSDGGSATDNKVNISGGTVGTGGTVYGGYISSATSAGGATGNSVTITGGSMGDVYGGFTTGTGKTTGNTVNLGDGEHSLAAGTTINGTIYGGNGTDTTGNTLNVKTNAAAANIKNFENLAFYVNSSALNAANPMLTLSSATNNLDWRKLTVDASKFSGTISTFEPYNLVLMQNAAGISFMKGTDDTYTLGGGVKSTTSGDFEFTIDTLSHTASATQVTAAGYKFKNHVASYSETTPHTEAWAGRTAAGNKVEKNKLTVTAGNITAAAYGGLVINNKPHATTGDAENNMIAVSGGNVQAAYGAKLLTKGGSATKNTAVITGGTVHDVYGASLAAVGATGTVTTGIVNLSNAANVTGNVYGGHIADSAATGTVTGSEVSLAGGTIGGTVYGGYNGGSGDAKDGKILLTGGTVAGDVYGGYAAGSGKTTGNVVTIGDGTNDATTVVTGKIAGGNKADATGNILDVQSKGAQAGTLSGFETIRFHLGQGVADGDNVLTLNQTTTLTYSTIEAPTGSTVSTWLGNVMEKNVHLLRMGAGKTLTLTGYHPATGSERSDDVEYSLVTNNNQSTTTAGGSLDLSAYKWRHADVKINSNAHANVFGGKTVYKTNGETKENKLTLQTGAAVTNAVAGDTQTASGTAEENTLTIEDGTATNAIGAKTKAGRAYKNKAILLGGSVTNLVGAESANGAAEENTAVVTGGTALHAIGAHTLAGDATGNHAVISGGAVTGSLKGAQSAGKAVKNTVEVKGGNLSGASVMGAEAAGDAEKNSVTITVTPTSNAATVITGAHSTGGSAVNNTVDVNAAVTGKIIGGSTDSAGLDAIDNIVNVNADVTGDVYGGHAVRASLHNIVNIADGITVTGDVYGGSCITAEGNIVNVGRGATVTGNVVAGNATGRNDNNIINLTGANVGGNVIGGVGGANDHDNTLAVCYETAHPTSHVSDFSGIKNLHFYLGEDIQNENPTLLKLGVTSKDIRGIDVGVGVKGRMARNLKVNDVISLMKVAGNGTLTTDADSVSPQVLVNHAEAMQGVSLLYGFDIMKRGTDELIATVTKAAISDQTKSFAETRAAATDFINRGANLLAGPGIASAKKAAGTEDKDARGYHLWAAMEHSDIETETGSFADTKGYHLSLGWARELKKKHATLTFTPFVEYGKGKYDSFLDDGTHGSGHVSYLGAGIMGRLEKTNGVWAEAALHGGKARSDYSGSIYSGTNSHYDSSNAYYAAHLGIGKEFRVNAKDRLDTYLRYFWSRQSGMQADIATSGRGAGVDTYDFGVVNSNRVRMGFRYTHKDSEKSEILAGLAWEYELSGKAGVSFQGYDAPSPSLRGGSLMLELAYRFAPKNSRFSYNVHMTGWQGTHRGVTGGAQVNWAF